MNYECKLCNYNTKIKANLNKHFKSTSHINKENINSYCYICNKQYINNTNYKKHKKYKHENNNINNRNSNIYKYNISIDTEKTINNKLENIKDSIENKIENINDNINNKINTVTEEINDVKEEINNSKKEVVTVVNKAINKASSLIKYLMENHRSVPPLKKITKQQCIPILRLDYECPEKENDYSLQKLFIRDHARNLFIPNIAKSILKMINYKNKDSQPIYNTDCTRYNYVVKLTTDLWNEDKAGIKFTDYIIRPLLRYVRELVEEYIEEDLEKINMYKNSAYENEQLLDKKEQAYTFDIALTNDYLIKPILKELSPYLRFLQLELEEMEKLEELEKIQEDLQEIINNNNDILSSYSEKDSDCDCDSINDNYITKIKKRMIKI